ncbi:MAG: hypothetical protein WKF86_00925 [Acidimicrobiales bacterium]
MSDWMSSLRLRQVAQSARRGDPALESLIDLSSEGSIFSTDPLLTFLMGGVLLNGRLMQETAFATHIDRTFSTIVTKAAVHVPEGSDPEDFRKVLLNFFDKDGVHRAAAERDLQTSRARTERLMAAFPDPPEGGLDLEDINDQSLAEDLVAHRAPRRSIALRDASLLLPSGDWQEIGVVRISVAQVDAWWLIAPEDDG